MTDSDTETGQPRVAVLALGSNLGEREATLAAAVRAIAELPGIALTAISPVYASAAVKPEGVDGRKQFLRAEIGGREGNSVEVPGSGRVWTIRLDRNGCLEP